MEIGKLYKLKNTNKYSTKLFAPKTQIKLEKLIDYVKNRQSLTFFNTKSVINKILILIDYERIFRKNINNEILYIFKFLVNNEISYYNFGTENDFDNKFELV